MEKENFAIRSTIPRRKRPSELEELQPSKKSSFAQRPQKGTVFSSLAVSINHQGLEKDSENAPRAATHPMKGGLLNYIKGPSSKVNFMFDTLENKAKLLEERMVRFVDILEKEYDIPAANATYSIANEPVVVVGRVCSDSSEGRINEASILLEGSMRHSKGLRVRLDTSRLKSLSLFPGQVIAVEGLNPSGHCITALSVLTGIPGPLSASEGTSDSDGSLSRVAIASGPFTTSTDLSFEPLKALIEKACQDNLDYLVLGGPFVDRDHPLIKSGTIDVEFGELFRLCCDSFSKVCLLLDKACCSPFDFSTDCGCLLLVAEQH